MSRERQDAPSELLFRRICSEFSEMPGLRLTRPQARRLWGLDEETCAQILDVLVRVKFLCLTSPETYGRLTEGPIAFPGLRIAQAKADRYAALPVEEVA